jgi:transcriptional regulator of met regulon
MATFRAAFIPGDLHSTSGGILLTDENDKDLPNDELLEKAKAIMKEVGLDLFSNISYDDICIGDWTE